MVTETWRPLIGFEGLYEVSDQGRVRGLDRQVPRGQGSLTIKGVVLRPIHSPASSYLTVSLKRGGKNFSTYIHRAVAEAFHGPAPGGAECCHSNGDALDNRAENLRWGTHSENCRDVVKHGRHNHASKTHCIRGHEFTPENTYRWKNARMCRACQVGRQSNRLEKDPR